MLMSLMESTMVGYGVFLHAPRACIVLSSFKFTPCASSGKRHHFAKGKRPPSNVTSATYFVVFSPESRNRAHPRRRSDRRLGNVNEEGAHRLAVRPSGPAQCAEVWNARSA